MLKIENFEVIGWEHAIRGMRNPMNSWDKSDTRILPYGYGYEIGPNDHTLMMYLAKAGPVHAKYRRMITVYLDVTAPLYWWKEFDTYKVGTVRNSCSTMHKIHSKEFTLEDFSHEHLVDDIVNDIDICIRLVCGYLTPLGVLQSTIDSLNESRKKFLETNDKKYWWQMIQLLPSSYNQRATLMLNYEVLVGIYRDRKNHKLDEWHVFCDWIKELPYSELITGETGDGEE